MHPLHVTLTTGMVHPELMKDPTRQTGRTTILAMRHIALAMDNPHIAIAVLDHHATLEASRYLCGKIRAIVNALSLDFFHFNMGSRAMIFTQSPTPGWHEHAVLALYKPLALYPEGMLALHTKTGEVYQALGTANDQTNSRAGSRSIIYHKFDGIYVREEAEFFNKFKFI